MNFIKIVMKSYETSVAAHVNKNNKHKHENYNAAITYVAITISTRIRVQSLTPCILHTSNAY